MNHLNKFPSIAEVSTALSYAEPKHYATMPKQIRNAFLDENTRGRAIFFTGLILPLTTVGLLNYRNEFQLLMILLPLLIGIFLAVSEDLYFNRKNRVNHQDVVKLLKEYPKIGLLVNVYNELEKTSVNNEIKDARFEIINHQYKSYIKNSDKENDEMFKAELMNKLNSADALAILPAPAESNILNITDGVQDFIPNRKD